MPIGKWIEEKSVLITIVAFVILSVVAYLSLKEQSAFVLALSAGGLGGIVHELFQSGGKIPLIKQYQDGYYLGSLAGMLFGAIAGIMAARFFLTGEPDQHGVSQLAYDTFLAGLGLKGVAEAAGGKAVV